MSETSWLWLGAVGMAAGSVALLFMARGRTRDEENHSVLHAIVPMLAFASYFAMATKQGSVILPSGREFLYARFVDWVLTTPLLLLGLATLAFGPRTKRSGLIFGLLAADIYMIVTGLFAGASEVGTATKWTWYLVSCGAFAAVYYLIWVKLTEEARVTGGESERQFRRNAGYLSIVWLAYPLVFLFGPEGLQTMGAVGAAACYTILDLVAKVGYGLMASASGTKKTTDELAAGLVPESALLGPSHPHHPPLDGKMAVASGR